MTPGTSSGSGRSSVIHTAREHYVAASRLESSHMPPHSKQWGPILRENGEFIRECDAVEQAISFAQKANYYDHRRIKHRPAGFIYQYFENILYNIHPSYREQLPFFSETPVSHDTVTLNNPIYGCDRLVSTAMYIHTSFILSCT